MKLLRIGKSTRAGKKMMAVFEKDGKTKTIHFGATGYYDYTTTPVGEREKKKEAYIARHKVNENFNDPDTAGSLARWILWNKPTIKASIRDYKKKFGF
tara:strand:+ start:2521 stop:2814 length:294 start_codon:yes stop_codon:yes gene_type:complete